MKKYNGDEDTEWQDVSELVSKYTGNIPHRDTCRRQSKYLFDLLDGGYQIIPPNEEVVEKKKEISDVSYNGNDNTYTYNKLIEIDESTEKITPELIMEKHNIDPTKWEVVSYKNNYWNTQAKGSKLLTLFQSKVTVKPIEKSIIDYDYIRDYFSNYTPEYAKQNIKRQYENGNKLLVPCFYDCHFGKEGWQGEVGVGENYDLKIAKQRFIDNSNNYISRIKDQKFEKILYVIGQDFIHSEPDGQTVNKTKQDCDGRYQKIFRVACEALVESITSFATIAPVDVVLIQGNHSETTEFFMAELLKAYFRNDNDINVDSSPMLRKYYRYGDTLLGLSHGEYEGKRITELMPVEAREDWGKTKYHEFLLGHLHSESSFEKGGITVRRIPSICGTDAWSKKMGYCTSPKRSVAFVYDKEQGLVETLYQPIDNL